MNCKMAKNVLAKITLFKQKKRKNQIVKISLLQQLLLLLTPYKMLKSKKRKNNVFKFPAVFVTVIGLISFSVQAQENGGSSGPVINMDKVKKEAREGNVNAMFVLGSAYIAGKTVAKDSIEAIKWYTKSAEKGNPAAMYILGYLYDNGKAIPKDTALALKWYTEGAEAGEPNALNNLGIKYRKGRWVARDYKKAMKLFKRSAEAGNAYGMLNVGQMYQYARGVKRDNAVALEWYLKAAEKSGVKVACYYLGYFYEYGKAGLAVNIETAISFYNKPLAKDEKAAAMYRLGNIYEYGKGTIKTDIQEALKYYLASAEGGNITGMYFLGHAYELVQRNDEAILWYKKAFDLCEKEIIRSIDDTELMICLAMMYENGKGTEKNTQLSLAWYKQAAELGNEDAEIKLKSFTGN